MPLRSNLFRSDRALEACLLRDAAHVTPGAVGDHVSKIQLALEDLDGAKIAAAEKTARRYGPSTTAAVLAYKRKRKIINFSYQSQADNIVGKMTIKRLDDEMFARQETPVPRPRVICKKIGPLVDPPRRGVPSAPSARRR